MKFTKKISLLLFFISVSLNVFAQDNEYQKHLEKAKEYESQKRWVYALGEYWDAMEAEPNINGYEAYKAFLTLGNTIYQGKPGFADYDDFTIFDEWINLLKDYEKYWAEKYPSSLKFYISKQSLNRENMTATYKVEVEFNRNQKKDNIDQFILQGIHAIKQFDSYLVKNWPSYSVYNLEKNKSYLIDGVALYSTTNEVPLYDSGEFRQNSLWNSSLTHFAHYNGSRYPSIDKSYSSDKPYFYKLSIDILDNTTGELLGKTNSIYCYDWYTAMEFTVSSDVMKKIDNKEVSYSPVVSVLYGTIEVPDLYAYSSNQKIKANFKEKKLLTEGMNYVVSMESKPRFIDSPHGDREKTLIEKIEQDIKISNFQKEAEVFYEELLATKKIVSKPTKQTPGKVKVKLTQEMQEKWRKFCENDRDAVYALCNLLSLYENLEPAYYNRNSPAKVSIDTERGRTYFVLNAYSDSYFAEAKSGWYYQNGYLIRNGQ